MPKTNDASLSNARPVRVNVAGGASCVEPRASIAAYSWDELKSIARKIAGASCRTEGLTIARAYRLVDDEFRLNGDTKEVVLDDGATARARILGFCHDELADGTGKAGISFEFADVPAVRRMNAGLTNEGGWQESEMRDWLNSVFWDMLPQDLSSNIVEVEKKTHYTDWAAPRGPVRHVTGAFDRLWLLSMAEVYGRQSVRTRNVPPYAATYDAEGTQYQLYSDHGVSVVDYEFCEKDRAGAVWWLRSPYAAEAGWFHLVLSYGIWGYGRPVSDWGVSPGFCF
ncbi:MAG: DUF6273 domain-containing protein [Atopobiaceae bacterium]|nr:DUF6273 domain-containing protein [Atopobiaceae bacterium]